MFMLLVGLLGACRAVQVATPPTSPTPGPSWTPETVSEASPASSPDEAQEVTLVAAGDISACDSDDDARTAALIAEREDAIVATLGDNVYPEGSDQTYAECYGPTWGAFLDRTRPAIGNHDDERDGGTAYFRYFGERAGEAGNGWYSYDAGSWHVIVLNSNCSDVACEFGSPQHAWLVADLAESDAACTLAYWHHPRFSSGPHGNDENVAPFWDALAAADADIVLGGHDHLYERFAPQTPSAQAAPDGIRQFTAGTGGRSHYEQERSTPNSEIVIDDAFGILELQLGADAYAWAFVTVEGAVADTGSAFCH
jgi:hypothetical protein